MHFIFVILTVFLVSSFCIFLNFILSLDWPFDENKIDLTLRKLYILWFKKDFLIEISSTMNTIVIPENSNVTPFRIYSMGEIKRFVSVDNLSYSELSKIISEIISASEKDAWKRANEKIINYFDQNYESEKIDKMRKFIIAKQNNIRFTFLKESKY